MYTSQCFVVDQPQVNALNVFGRLEQYAITRTLPRFLDNWKEEKPLRPCREAGEKPLLSGSEKAGGREPVGRDRSEGGGGDRTEPNCEPEATGGETREDKRGSRVRGEVRGSGVRAGGRRGTGITSRVGEAEGGRSRGESGGGITMGGISPSSAPDLSLLRNVGGL